MLDMSQIVYASGPQEIATPAAPEVVDTTATAADQEQAQEQVSAVDHNDEKPGTGEVDETVKTGDDGDEPEVGEENKRDPYKGFRKKIDKQHARIKDNERQMAEMAHEIEQLQQRLQARKSVDVESLSDSDYINHLSDTRYDERQLEEHVKKIQSIAQSAQRDAWVEKVESAIGRMPDYDQVLAQANVQIPREVTEAIMDSEFGPDIAYHLAKNPDLAVKIGRANPIVQAKEIMRLEMMIEAQVSKAPPAPAAKPQSKAPAPTPAPGKGSAPKPAHQMSMEELIKQRYGAFKKGY